MKKLLLLIILIPTVFACKTEDPNQKFDSFKEVFISKYWEVYPNYASVVGYHNYDSVLTVPDKASNERKLAFAAENLSELAKFDLTKLSDHNKIDYRLIENELKGTQWRINEEKSFEWDPSGYNVANTFAPMLTDNYDSLDTRLHHFGLKLRSVPAYYEAAKRNIKNPTLEHTELAIEQNIGGASTFEDDLKFALEKSNLSDAEKQEIKALAGEAAKAMKDYAGWLKNLDNKAPRSFRLGSALYKKKFEFDIQSGYTVDQIYQKAVTRKKYLNKQMAEIANQLWPKYLGAELKPADTLDMIKQVIDKVSLKHVSQDSFQIAIENQIPELVKFVKEKDLLYLDPSKPLVVRREPPYMAGVALASITAPGPYDKNGNTYYNVGNITTWEKDRAESFLREYNYYLLQVLNIHEAIPGHYTQLIYNNQSPSIVKSIFGNGAMVEGWAVYTELMMLENGYGNHTPEMWLMYYKFNLRATCNTILDIGVHTGEMSKESALNMLIKEAFQQDAEAHGKWRRVSLTSVQLCSYFTGFTEIYDLRKELEGKQGDQFKLKAFHESFLSYGSAPVKYIRELMLAASD
jgi:uncharacterized protein (DUF885 family)